MSYSSDVRDREWEEIGHLLERKHNRCRPRIYKERAVYNAIRYVIKTGCQWRMVPKEFGHWRTIYKYYEKWKAEGIFEKINEILRKLARKKKGKSEEASLGIVDSQSIKTVQKGDKRGFDGHKKNQGKKETYSN
jgi:putative transposase